MNDMNWKTWALVIVVAMGITFEAIKRLPNDNSKWTANNLKFENAKSTPYQVKYKRVNSNTAPGILPMKTQVVHVAGNAAVNRETIEKFLAANTTHTSEFNHAGKGAEGKDAKLKKKKKDDGDYEIIIDPRTGKRYRRKKKKVAKVEEVKAPEVAKEEPKKEEAKKDDDIDGLMNQAIAQGGLPPVNDQADSPHVDLEEWKRRLLTRPDAAETRRFIEHYKNSIVTAEIFYKITALMIDDPRPPMKDLGVLCAGLTPSVLSFQVLADVVKEERSGSNLRKYSESFMNTYSSLGNLYVLERVLKSPSSSFMAVQATKRLDTSANTYLAPSKNKPPKGTSTTAAASHSNANYFRRFVTILQTLVRNPDAQVNEQARQTLATINTLMSVNGVPATVTPPANGSTPPAAANTPPAQASTQPL